MNEENISSLLRELGHVEPISISIISDIQSVIEVSKDIDLFELTTVLNGVVCWRNYQLCMAAMFGGETDDDEDCNGSDDATERTR